MAKLVSALVLSATILGVWSAPAPQLFYQQQPAVASVSSNVLRTPGNLGQISTYSKSLDTPTSSVRKSDIRISNDALAYQSIVPAYNAPLAYHAPVTAYHAPVATAYHAPVTAYHAPVTAYHAPVAAPAVATHSLLGVAYSPATSVAHVTFDGPGVHYVF